MKRVWKAKEVINGWTGTPIKIEKPDDPFDEEEKETKLGKLTILDAMLVISNLFRCETLEDSSKKKALKQALKASMKSGLIELEGEVFKWLKTASEKASPLAWQENANEVHDIITEGFRKENEKANPPKEVKTEE